MRRYGGTCRGLHRHAGRGAPLCRRRAFITLNEKMRERLWARVNAKAEPLRGVKVKPGTQWLKPGLVGRVRHVKGEQLLRHATLQEIREE